MEFVSFLPTIIGIVTVVVGSLLVAKSQAIKTALENYKELAKSYEEKTRNLQSKNGELESEADRLRQELKIVKNMPLKTLSNGVTRLIESQVHTSSQLEQIKDDIDDIRSSMQ